MRKNNIILPGESTVQRWLNSINYSTGFPEKYMEQLKLKTLEMTYAEKKVRNFIRRGIDYEMYRI